MAPAKTVIDLAVRKQMLVAESEANRQAVRAEFSHLIQPTRWLESLPAYAVPVLIGSAVVGGLLVTRRLPQLIRWGSAGWAAAKVVHRLVDSGLLKRRGHQSPASSLSRKP